MFMSYMTKISKHNNNVYASHVSELLLF